MVYGLATDSCSLLRTGSTGMKRSAEYPEGFAKAVATNHLDLMVS